MNNWETLPYGPRPELNGKYPYPEVLADYTWLHDELDAWRLDEYRGRIVAAHDKRIVGTDTDHRRLSDAVEARCGIEPFRIVITYVEE